MEYELSMCLAGIRPHFWKNVYDTAIASCTRYSWEMVIISPYLLPDELKQYDNITHIQEYGSPVRASQIGAMACKGRLIAFPCDDGVFIPGGFDQAIDLYNAVGKHKDGIVLRYKEGAGMNAPSFPESYWYARSHLPGHLHIGNDWKIAPQPMLSLDFYKEIGGVDCTGFECMAFATHDLCYRMQRCGGVFHLSPIEVMNADNYGECGVDHAPIFYGQTSHDHPEFFQMYSNPAVCNRTYIDFDTWKAVPDFWHRRWKEKGVPV